MICYLDRAFCISPNCRCGRKLTDEIKAAADRWWVASGGQAGDAPIATAYMCDNPADDAFGVGAGIIPFIG
jgi:hypothetical protein